MSVLTSKHVLIIGDDTNQISKVEAALITYGATVTSTTCETVSSESIAAQGIDAILVNHLHASSTCRGVLEMLQQAQFETEIPVLALVRNSQSEISDVFMLGVTDYVTPQDDVHQVVERIKSFFADGTEFTETAAIDITPASSNAGDGIRVFAIEDDPLLRNLLAVRFEKSNLPFELAEDGENIVELVSTFHPQIIILDLMLPGKDGFTVLKELKESPVADIPVIIFSNKDSQSDRKQAEELGAVAFYVKAMTDLAELLQVIEKYAKR